MLWVGQCFVTAEPHDIRLTWVSKVNQRIEDSYLLSFRPVGAMFTKEASDDLLRAKDKRVASAITPTEVHSIGFDVDARSIVDVLADVVQQVGNRNNLDLAWCQQATIGEQKNVQSDEGQEGVHR